MEEAMHSKKPASRVYVNDALLSENKSQCIYCEVMHVDGKKFLISVTDLLQLTLQSRLASEGKMSLGMALQNNLSVLRTQGFELTIVYIYMDSCILHDTGGASEYYIDKVDAKINETWRSVKSGLAWELHKTKVKDLVAYAMSLLNLQGAYAVAESTRYLCYSDTCIDAAFVIHNDAKSHSRIECSLILDTNLCVNQKRF
jgi:hypothetical protein